MGLKIKIPHGTSSVVFEILPGGELDTGDLDVAYEEMLVAMNGEPSLPLRVRDTYMDFGVLGMQEFWEMIEVVGQAVERDIEHGGAALTELRHDYVDYDDENEDSADEGYPPGGGDMVRSCTADFLLDTHRMYNAGKRLIEHASEHHENLNKALGAHTPSRFRQIGIEEYLGGWLARVRDGVSKEMPDMDPGIPGWKVTMLESHDPRILWWDGVWHACAEDRDQREFIWNCVHDMQEAAYVVTHEGNDVAIFWAWRWQAFADDEGEDREESTWTPEIGYHYKKLWTGNDEPGNLLVIDSVHIMEPGDLTWYKQVLDILQGAAEAALKDDWRLHEVRLGNSHVTTVQLNKLLHTKGRHSLKLVGKRGPQSEDLERWEDEYVWHPTIQIGAGIEQWLLAKRKR